eukprot:CAMPEP_0177175716 /NCGR_PEP_ID=MMETSP0367-20130122/12862_1 /TAXON_ID=447022 ORGANISM="Scrippsiella hangoei-like, Strain SHHI-4" /NCGR_SAMPLE_ID=MMETSP0367 /ASSEMBLY_ACC=CAM_ASM_000362 /LENGTH=448 /DNA_ID=CAMNT_0018622163 /DNA_START=66 /DNA_END=1412 /DNA_ORIENTATION=+
MAHARHTRLAPALLLGAAGVVLYRSGCTFVGGGAGAGGLAGRVLQAHRVSATAVRARGGDDAVEDDDEEFVYEFDDNAFVEYSSLKIGQKLDGIVQKVMPFGCFIDVGADKQGMAPLGKMSEARIEDPNDVVKVGDTVECWVASKDNGKLTLALTPSKIFGPRDKAPTSAFQGMGDQFMDGTIVQIQSFGAFVSIMNPAGGPPGQGLLPVSQIGETRVDDINSLLEVGQTVKVRVAEVNVEKDRIGLSMRMPEAARANASDFEGVPNDQWFDGVVVAVQVYGAFVKVTSPLGSVAQGLVPISQVSDMRIDDLSSVLTIGQTVKVRVAEIDLDKDRISLSMRVPDAARASASDFEGVPDDQWFDGVVVTLKNYGAFIKLTSPSGLVAKGLLPNKEIADTFVEDPGEYLEMDMEVKVRIVSIDQEKNRISLSMLQKKEAKMNEAAAPAAA